MDLIKQEKNDTVSEELTCKFFDLGLRHKVINLFLVKDKLFIISQANIFMGHLDKCPDSMAFVEVLCSKRHLGTESFFSKVIYSSIHDCFYSISDSKNENTLICNLKL